LDTTTTLASGLASAMIRSTSSPVPTGTVDLVTMDGEPRNRGRDLARGHVDVAEVGMAVAAPRRRADRDEHRLRLGDRPREVGGEIEPPLAHVGGHQAVEAGLEYGNVSIAQARDLGAVFVDAGHVVTEVGKACPGHEPDISGADHGDAHEIANPRVRPL
jgi:hypothetical protein